MTARSSVLSAGGLTTLSDILKAQALKTPERCLFSYQREDGLVEVSLRQLDLEATAIAHRLQRAYNNSVTGGYCIIILEGLQTKYYR